MRKFQAAQGELSQALKSLFAVTENYPELKSDQNFRDLQAQLEGTENRITVARNRYIEAVQTLQRHRALLSHQPHRDDVRAPGEAQLHGGERSGGVARRRRWISAAAPN